jgi:DNA-binding MarR family transcriptional regulator
MLENHWLAADALAARLGLPQRVRDSVAQTFERWDGKGVPKGVQGEEILITSRLVTLADVVEVYHRAGGTGRFAVEAQDHSERLSPLAVVFSYRKKYTADMEKSSTDVHEFMEPEEWESWTALLMLHRTVLQDLDAELRQQHKLAVSEFDVLITLFSAPDSRLGMSALAQQAMLSPAGTTHLVTRLERDGLVKREVDPADRRKWFTVLTNEGDRALRAARHTHNAVLRRTFLAATSPADRQVLTQLWQRLSSAESGTDQH